MSSDENLRRLEGSIETLNQIANELLNHAKVALNDTTKRESLLAVKARFDSAVLDYKNRFDDFNNSLR